MNRNELCTDGDLLREDVVTEMEEEESPGVREIGRLK